MKAVIHKTGAIGEVLGIERRDGVDYVYFESGLSLPVSEVGFLTPYEQYVEDCYDWDRFRAETARDVIANVMDGPTIFNARELPEIVSRSIKVADELIKQLNEK